MFENDYIMRLIMDFVAAIRRSIEREDEQRDPAEAARALDLAAGDAVDLGTDDFLSLAPTSAAGILELSGTDPKVVDYVSHTLLLASTYYAMAGENALSDLRRQQAYALAGAYGCDLPEENFTAEDMNAYLDAMDESLEDEAGDVADAQAEDLAFSDARPRA